MFVLQHLLQAAVMYRILSSISMVIKHDPECPTLMPGSGEIISMPEYAKRSKPSLCLPSTDCFALSLEYFDRAIDLKNFRRASKHFDRIYQRYKECQSNKFYGLHLLFNNSEPKLERYRSLEELLHTVPCIPGMYVDIESTRSMEAVSRSQYRANREIVRGLTCGENHPFLSLSMYNEKEPRNAVFVICVFAFDDLADVVLVKYHHSIRPSAKFCEFWDATDVWSLGDLIDELNSGTLEGDGGTWHLVKRPWSQCTERGRKHNDSGISSRHHEDGIANVTYKLFPLVAAGFITLCPCCLVIAIMIIV